MMEFFIVALYLKLRTDLDNLALSESSCNAVINDGGALIFLKNKAQALLLKIASSRASIQAQIDAIGTATQKTTEKNNTINDFEIDFTAFGESISSVAAGSKDVIDKYKLPSSTKGKQSPIGHLSAPHNFSATQGDNPGEIELMWDGVKGAKTYQVKMQNAAEPQVSFIIIATPTKSKYEVTGLVSGGFYSFKVLAVGAEGEGDISEPITKAAP